MDTKKFGGFILTDKNKGKFAKIIDIIFESIEFIILNYLLLSGMFSFKNSAVYILFFAVNVVIIQKFWTSLKRALQRKIAVVAVFIICITVLTVLFLTFGYLSMSLMPVKTS